MEVEAPTGDPNEWDNDALQRWFATYDGGVWAKYASKFAQLDGKRMSALSNEDFLLVVEPPYGSAIYHDWRKLVAKGTFGVCVLRLARYGIRCFPDAACLPACLPACLLACLPARYPVTRRRRGPTLNLDAAKPVPSGCFKYQPDVYRYVHKMGALATLMNPAQRCMFLTGPRRFGKSLLLDMVHLLAQGQWQAFPEHDHWDADPSDVSVIRLDFQCGMPAPPSKFDEAQQDVYVAKCNAVLAEYLRGRAQAQHGISLARSAGTTTDQLLTNWVEQLGGRVVLLIDEFNYHPIECGAHGNMQAGEAFATSVLKPLFANTKSTSSHSIIKVIAAGVGSVSLVSLASGANHFQHADQHNPNLLGFTRQEVRDTYPDLLLQIADRAVEEGLLKEGTDTDGVDALLDWFATRANSWRLAHGAEPVYNPFSLMSAFEALGTAPETATRTTAHKLNTAAKAWVQSGLASTLVQLLKQNAVDLLVPPSATAAELVRRDHTVSTYFSSENPAQLAVDFGYLTRGPEQPGSDRVLLRVPNDAVRESIEQHVAESKFMPAEVATEINHALTAPDPNEENVVRRVAVACAQMAGCELVKQ